MPKSGVREDMLLRPQVGASQELTLEQQILGELRDVNEQLGQVKQNQEMLKIELLGREGAPEHGRLPRAEAKMADHEERITRLERAYFIAGVAVGAMGMKALAPLAAILAAVLKGH